MRLLEFASSEEQLALWKLVSDSMWTAIAQQAKQEAAERAEKQRLAKLRAKSKPPKRAPAPDIGPTSPPPPLPEPKPLYPSKPVAKSAKLAAAKPLANAKVYPQTKAPIEPLERQNVQ